MKITASAILIFTAMLVPCAVACHKQHAIQPEVLIPEDMPVVLSVSLDENERELTKYLIRRTVGPDVNEVAMILFAVGPDNKVDTAPNQLTIAVTAKNEENASYDWEKNDDVRRFIVIVQSVETSSGR